MVTYSEQSLLGRKALPRLLSGKHLQDQTSKTPNIHLGTVRLWSHHLRSHPNENDKKWQLQVNKCGPAEYDRKKVKGFRYLPEDGSLQWSDILVVPALTLGILFRNTEIWNLTDSLLVHQYISRFDILQAEWVQRKVS